MLTDIFARRYRDRPLFDKFEEDESRLLVQAYRIVNEQVFPYRDPKSNKVNEWAKEHWTAVHSKLSMEFGVKALAETTYSWKTTWNGVERQESGTYDVNLVCESWLMQQPFHTNFDKHLKQRISFIELAFREREEMNKAAVAKLAQRRAAEAKTVAYLKDVMSVATRLESEANARMNRSFEEWSKELNVRFEQAGMVLNYHNGFIQITTDALTQKEIDKPFWDLVKDPKWTNVDMDMKEALDLRDSGGRDPALYSAKALESTIKIISDERGWTTGSEKGAHNYLDNLGSAANGQFIAAWERDAMKHFFTHVRNPLGHGPGGEKMPELSDEQTTSAIESCMSWIKSLIDRL